MKKLTRLKLINWHRFNNITIDFGETTLISGENGAGKSTLLDAIQFVVTCSANHFNKAAHENGKRKLTGYIRCKTGRENKPYERMGEISAHVALEFYEEGKDKYFIVGAVVDSATEGQEAVARYLMDNTRLEEDMFVDGKKPRSMTQFRTYNGKKIKQFVKTNKEAQKIMKQRFGRIEDKFFSLVPKALAFKPIDDIKDFVYSYVLDTKEVNIDSLRENVRSYQELEKTLDGVKKRITKLEAIEKAHTEIEECLKSDDMYEYFLAQSEVDITLENIDYLKKQIENDGYALEELKKELLVIDNIWNTKQDIRTSLRVEMDNNKEFQVLLEQEKILEGLKEKNKELKIESEKLFESGKKAKRHAVELLKVKDVDVLIKDYDQMLSNLKNTEDIVLAKALVNQVITYKNRMRDRLNRKSLEIQMEMEECSSKLKELNKKIEDLRRQRFSYPPNVELLRGKIEQEFLRIGRTRRPKIICELLDIADEKWRNAVEGYLKDQRFNILVEPEDFDIALGIYNKLQREKKVYGAGLINTAGMDAYDVAPKGSLATMVVSENIYAKRYINMILGRVVMCQRYEELKKYPVAITAQCMRYQNHVASAINPKNYEKPYIGQNAIKIQLEQTIAKKEQMSQKTDELKEKEKQISHLLKPLDTDADTDIKYRLDVLGEMKRHQMMMRQCQSEINELKKNSTLIEKQIRLDELTKECQETEQKKTLKNREIGSKENRIDTCKKELQSHQQAELLQREAVEKSSVKAGELLPLWKGEYEKQTAKKSYEDFRTNFSRRRKANQTTKENVEKRMSGLMTDYKMAFDFGAAPTYEAYPEYAAIYDRLVHSELLSYEEKAVKARKSAEEEFQEQFLSKLRENVTQAQKEFKELNKALQGIQFSHERYQFIYMPRRIYAKYYDMIMDDFNIQQGESIFSGIFHENHKEVIEELFEKLALDQENETKALDEFTDYRTYLDYDIKIIHEDDNYSLYSKVCEEKSGGETQTPFYVTVAASFVQMYANNIGGEAIGLVMFDEAFNNMDDERIGGVLEFLNRLPLQIIIAAPPDKIQYISPKMEETLLVLTDEKLSFVEEYRYDSI